MGIWKFAENLYNLTATGQPSNVTRFVCLSYEKRGRRLQNTKLLLSEDKRGKMLLTADLILLHEAIYEINIFLVKWLFENSLQK